MSVTYSRRHALWLSAGLLVACRDRKSDRDASSPPPAGAPAAPYGLTNGSAPEIYFPGDPYNEGDPFIHRSLIMGMEKAKDRMLGRYDFVLRGA